MLDDLVNPPSRPVRPSSVPCLIDEGTGQPMFLSELRSRSDALARTLQNEMGIGENDLVSIFTPNHTDYLTIIWAVHRLGGIVSAINPGLTQEELVYHLQIARPALLIAHGESLSTAIEGARVLNITSSRVIVIDRHQGSGAPPCICLEELIARGLHLPPIKEFRLRDGQAKTQVAILCFSSGTTGKPKAVAVSHYNLICNVIQSATHHRVNDNHVPWEERRFRPGDVVSGVIPFYHMYGILSNLHWMIYSAMTVVVTQKFKYETMLQNIERFHITHLIIVPPQAVLLCKACEHPATKNYNLSSVRFCMVAAAPVTAELISQLLEALPGSHLGQGYGMTETTAAVCMFPTTQKVGTPGSAGQLVPGTIAKIVKPDGSLAGYGEPGELLIQGGQVSLGYYGNEAATKEAFRDGWLKSGDEVVIRENGDIFVVDRIKEFIKVKGLQVAPGELEGHLLNHPQIADACVIGIPDAYAGEIPLAFIVLQPDAAASAQKTEADAAKMKQDIVEYVAATKSRHKWLTGGVVFIDAIPKSPSGKILRRILREKAKTFRKPISSHL
ncbi:amp dependent CoA ligase [Wolfiporia cocos MD-104 SS10]|uniref:Amp dependent CoA ligase n=1 Tax=Wolfiporia cocos (strain MD-104) TaxID=742152 RepID=A0A2H3JSI9_WOLCO|nr:amp dependent CoA ligase [Wolfiporia cocos MD-104 SS10]